MIERTESVVEKRTVVLASPEGLSAEISDDGLKVTVVCSTIDGQSALRVTSSMVATLTTLVAAVKDDPALVIPPPPPPEPPAEDPPA